MPPSTFAAAESTPVPGSRRDNGVPTLAKVSRLWRSSAEWVAYREPLREHLDRVPGLLDQIAGDLEQIITALPPYYCERVRPATSYLFREWMPIGYAAMLPIEDPDELRRATLALMHYGAAVTVLDDVADSDLFEQITGPGGSDEIAQAVLRALFPRTNPPAAKLRLGALPVVEFAVAQTWKFLDFWRGLGRHRELERELQELLNAFFYSVPTCRRVRARLSSGTATKCDLSAMQRAIPHGMTVALVGLTGLAHHRSQPSLPTRLFLRDAQRAQLACHYQNALATLEREFADGDPSNPIVLEAMRRGDLDPRDYMIRRVGSGGLRACLRIPRQTIRRQLTHLQATLKLRRTHYERLGAGRFFERYDFGVRHLGFLYQVARGSV